MGAISAIIGSIGGLCAIFGIVTAMKVIAPMSEELTWMFWFVLAAILLLAAIALNTGRGGAK